MEGEGGSPKRSPVRRQEEGSSRNPSPLHSPSPDSPAQLHSSFFNSGLKAALSKYNLELHKQKRDLIVQLQNEATKRRTLEKETRGVEDKSHWGTVTFYSKWKGERLLRESLEAENAQLRKEKEELRQTLRARELELRQANALVNRMRRTVEKEKWSSQLTAELVQENQFMREQLDMQQIKYLDLYRRHTSPSKSPDFSPSHTLQLSSPEHLEVPSLDVVALEHSREVQEELDVLKEKSKGLEAELESYVQAREQHQKEMEELAAQLERIQKSTPFRRQTPPRSRSTASLFSTASPRQGTTPSHTPRRSTPISATVVNGKSSTPPNGKNSTPRSGAKPSPQSPSKPSKTTPSPSSTSSSPLGAKAAKEDVRKRQIHVEYMKEEDLEGESVQ